MSVDNNVRTEIIPGRSTTTPALDTIEYTEALLHYMQQRFDIASAVKQLSEATATASRDGDANVTLGFISRKQGLLENLESVQQQLALYLNDDPETRVWSSPQRRQQCRQLSEQGTRILQETAQIEESAIQEMTTKRDAIAAQLQDGRDSTIARTVYGTSDALSNGGLDVSDL